jgi:hypothetical protein
MHDMAQLVSEDECFVVKNMSQIHDVPPNVRHLSILPSGVDDSVLLSLGKHRKLRTLLLNTNISLLSETSSSVMDCWNYCTCVLFFFGSVRELPESIDNLKHLRYLKTSRPYRKPRTLPSSFYCLYNLQVFDAEGFNILSLPMEVNKLTKLQRFKSRGFQYYRKSVTHINGREMEIGWMKYANLSFTDLIISDLDFICQDDATEAELKNIECL